jgi:hypothetical protein
MNNDNEEVSYVSRKDWIRITVLPYSDYFPIVQKILRIIAPKQKEITIKVLNKRKSQAKRKEVKDLFKLVFDDEEQCGFEFFMKEGE